MSGTVEKAVQDDSCTVICSTCFYHCRLARGQIGQCSARYNHDGKIQPLNYGQLTALALDPIEKKPLKLFYPGKMILSAGSYGCNLHCPFCQNADISQSGSGCVTEYVSPEDLAGKAAQLTSRGNIGVAYTYNEPLVCWEYVRDTSKLVHERGMKNVIVTNGCVTPAVLDEVLPYTDAMNIDLKGFTEEWYKELKGDFETVKASIVQSVKRCHVELTTLIVPGRNDSEDEMSLLAGWVASIDRNIALHITRFFPRYHMTHVNQTPVRTIYELADTARRYLPNVFPGNC
jgi:pyruvate formate lyase activating enzyme